jgi:hypothetical protein
MKCACGLELRAVPLRKVEDCGSCGGPMSTGFECVAVRDLICDMCVHGFALMESTGGPLVHKGESFGDGFEAGEPDPEWKANDVE